MNCSNATAPINITKNTDKVCDLKCKYSFNYPITNLQITNRSDHLSIRTEPEQSPSVVFNADKYNVKEIRIYTPSLHTYGGQKADGEILIMHNNITGNGDLIVSVPLLKNNGEANNDASSLLNGIILDVSQRAPSIGQQTSVNLPTFTLNKIISNNVPYFSYKGTLPFTPCDSVYDYVVFDKANAVSINSNAFAFLNKIIVKNKINVATGGDAYYNKHGASKVTDGADDDIYIECKPTGSDGSVLVTTEDNSISFKSPFNNVKIKDYIWIIQLVLGAIVIFILMKVFGLIIDKLFSNDINVKSGAMATA